MQPLEADDPRDLGDYRLLGRLGAGGMGQVYLGRTPGGRTVAVKAVRPELARDREFRERFRQEVAAARRVGGQWTAPVLDADTEGLQPWVASGFVAGPSLAAAVHEHGPLPETTVRLLGVGLAEALAHVHGLGLVHRDVKPSNVLLTLDGPRLIDFGIARALDASSGLTQTGHVVGSPGFMSPEQAQGQPAGPPSDVFSLGAVLALAGSGRQPFGEGVSGAVLLYRVLHEQPDLSALAPGLREVILGCLAKHPADRPTPQQLRERLDPEGTAAAQLGRSSWLSADLAASVGRTAVRLLDLEGDTRPSTPAPAGFGPPPPGAYGPTVPYSYGPSTPPPAPAPVPAPVPVPPRKRRGPLIAGITAGVLVLGGLAGYGIANLGSGDGGSGGGSGAAASVTPDSDRATDDPSDPASDPPSDSASDPASPKSSPSPKNVASKSPSATSDSRSGFLGEWGATIGNDKAITVRVLNTRVNDQHAGESHLETADGYCEGTWTLISASASKLVFTSRLGEHNVNCDVTGRRELELLPDGTLRYTATSDNNSNNDPLTLRRID